MNKPAEEVPLTVILEDSLARTLGDNLLIHAFVFCADVEGLDGVRELRLLVKQNQPPWVTTQLVNELSEWGVEGDDDDE